MSGRAVYVVPAEFVGEMKAFLRHIASPEGAAYYGGKIGDAIVADTHEDYEPGKWSFVGPTEIEHAARLKIAQEGPNVLAHINAMRVAKGQPKLTPLQYRQRVSDVILRDEFPDAGNKLSATTIPGSFRGQVRNGESVIEFDTRSVSPARVARVAQILDELLKDYPPEHPYRNFKVLIRKQLPGSKAGDRALGKTIPGSSVIYLAETALDDDLDISRYPDSMPSFYEDPLRYTIAHEYGHVLAHKGIRVKTYQQYMDIAMRAAKAKGLSGYAMGEHEDLSPVEATEVLADESWADAFAEWFMTSGKTHNEWVQEYGNRWPQVFRRVS